MRIFRAVLLAIVVSLSVGVSSAFAACNGLSATISGTSGNNTITGTSGADVIEGLGGDDTISGLGANDTICGGDGYDTIKGGSGDDWIDGGSGADLVDYSALSAAMTIDLGAGTASGDGSDTISNVSDAYGGSGADTITGTTIANFLVGYAGNDTFVGAAGNDYFLGGDDNDTLQGGADNDTLNGGNGTDYLDYTNAGSGITLNLTTTSSQSTGGAGSDTQSNNENVTGSDYADTLTGTSAANVIHARDGADSITAGDGGDTLTGGSGSDTITAEGGNDSLDLDEGATDSGSSTCGGGTDTALIDSGDTISYADCETVTIDGAADTTAPTISFSSFTEGTNPGYQHAVGSTMYVQSAQSGSFTLVMSASDSGSGIQQLEFPTLGSGWSPAGGNDTSNPYSLAYSWTMTPANPGSKTVTARDNANNTNTASFTVAHDATAPTGATITAPTGFSSSSSASISFTTGSDSESGLGAHQLQRRSATLTSGTCGTFGSWSDIGGSSPSSPYSDTGLSANTCYEYQINVLDNVSNTATTTASGQLKVDQGAPTGLSVSNLSNDRVDGVAVLTWTAASDSQSGLDHYEVKVWADGQAEPSDSAYRSTGSTGAFANIRLGVNPASSNWDWKWRVRAVDAVGNTTSSSSVALIDDTANQVSGSSGDQSMTHIADLGQVGHATGNLSIQKTDVDTKAYGVSLTAGRAYNHQNIQLQPVIGDTGWNNSPGPADTPHSYTSQWSYGFHWSASWEQRLVSGDDGSSDGHADTLTFIDESGTNWPFTATAASAATYASPVGMDDATLVSNPSSGTYPTCETGGVDSSYALAQRGGSTKCFDSRGRLMRETMRNGRSITYTRNGDGRVTTVTADDPDGGGSETALALTVSYNADKRISKIADQLGRETRYTYVDYSGMYYLESVAKYADSGSSTALTKTEYAWDSNSSARRIVDVDEWIYSDDPATGTSNDALKHHFDIVYNGSNQVSTVTEVGTVGRDVGTASPTLESIPSVADTVTTMSYVSLTPGGSAASLSLDVDTGTVADDDAFGTYSYTVDWLGRVLTSEKPLEAGASTRAESVTTYTADGRVATQTDERGDVTTNTYNNDGDLTQSVVDHAASGVPNSTSQFADFTASGSAQTATELRAPDGSFLRNWPYAIDECVDTTASGTFKVTTAGTSASTEPSWPGSGTVSSGSVVFTKLTCTPTPQGVTTTYEFDSNSNQLESQDAQGVRTCSYYETSGEVNVSYKLDGSECPGSPSTGSRIKGSLTDHTYNAAGFLTQTETDESTNKFTHDTAGQQTEQRLVVDSGDSTKDIVTTTEFDGAGRSKSQTRTDPDSTTRTTSTTYTMNGLVAQTTVPNSTHPTGLLLGAPAGDIATTRYSAHGLGYLEIRADDTIVTRHHDGQDRETYTSVPHAQTNAAPEATEVAYFHSGQKKTKEDPAGIITTYDASQSEPGGTDKPVEIDSPVSGETTFTYNAQGNEASKTTSAGTWAYGYDGQGNRVKTTHPSGAVSIEIKDRQGNVTERRYTPSGGSASVTTRSYTADGKLDTENQPSGLDTDNAYSTSTGQLEQSVLDDDGSAWLQEMRFAWDAAGRVATETLENGGSDLVTTYSYENKSGRVSEVDRPDGSDDRYVYDEQGRTTELKTIKESNSSWVGGDTYSYDEQSRITSRVRRETSNSYQQDYAYDPAGQLVSESSEEGIIRSYVYGNANTQGSFGTDMQRQTLHLTAAPAGSLSVARIDEIEECLSEAEDCAATDEAAIDTAFADIAAPQSTVDPSGLSSVDAEVAQYLKLRDGRSWEATAAYVLGECVDPGTWGGNRYKVTTAGTSASSEPTWPGSGTVSDGSVVWTKDTCTPITVLREYTYDSSSPSKHQLTQSVDQYGVAEYYHYDARGNQDYRASSAYSGTPNQAWDELNRPTSLKDDDGNTVTLNWVRDEYKLESWVVSGVTRTLQYDANDRVVRVAATGSESWDVEYSYDQAGIASFKTGGDWYHLDRSTRGDVTAIRNSSGVTQAQIRYTAYGEQWSDNSTFARKLGATYNGRDRVIGLSEGLSWMTHRVYSSASGRFIGSDAVAARVGGTQSTYNYADGDPVNNLDPSGNATTDQCYYYGDLLGWHEYYGLNVSLQVRASGYNSVHCEVRVCFYSGFSYNPLYRFACSETIGASVAKRSKVVYLQRKCTSGAAYSAYVTGTYLTGRPSSPGGGLVPYVYGGSRCRR